MTDPARLARLRQFRPQLAEAVEGYEAFAASMLDPTIVELCRLRIAQIQDRSDVPPGRSAVADQAGISEAQLSALATWQDSDEFDPRQKACLDLAECFCYSAQGVTDEHFDRLYEHLSTEQILTLTAGLWVADASGRLATFFRSLEVPG